MSVQIACIVEGHGEVGAVPVLIRRIAAELYPDLSLVIPHPIRISKAKLVKSGELERTVELAARQIGGSGAVFILIDSDTDCPAQLGPALLQRALHVRGNLPIAVVLAKCEFEAWFLSAAESLRGQRGLLTHLRPPPEPEEIRDAKGWLNQRMERGRRYSERPDQPAFTARFDFTAARRADSFDKCYRDIIRLLSELREAGQM
jgi:hypothetical protein